MCFRRDLLPTLEPLLHSQVASTPGLLRALCLGVNSVVGPVADVLLVHDELSALALLLLNLLGILGVGTLLLGQLPSTSHLVQSIFSSCSFSAPEQLFPFVPHNSRECSRSRVESNMCFVVQVKQNF